jgi:hypothetical protein
MILRSALLWAVCGPPFVALLYSVVAVLSGGARMMPGILGLLVVWPIFAPGAAVAGALVGWLLLWTSQHAPSLAALRARGLAWGAGLGLLGFLCGFLILVILTQGEGPERSWGDLGWGLITVPLERPEVIGAYAAVILSGAILGWMVAGWAARVHSPRES